MLFHPLWYTCETSILRIVSATEEHKKTLCVPVNTVSVQRSKATTHKTEKPKASNTIDI